jgi:hypothetical protein
VQPERLQQAWQPQEPGQQQEQRPEPEQLQQAWQPQEPGQQQERQQRPGQQEQQGLLFYHKRKQQERSEQQRVASFSFENPLSIKNGYNEPK